jgi:hypothetical protein
MCVRNDSFINDNVENVRARKLYKERRAIRDRDCKVLHRYQPENILWLSRYFLNHNEETRGGALTNKQKMKIFLRFVGNLGFQSGVAEDLGFHQTTVSKVIADIATKIVEKAPLWINFPSTEEEFEAAKAGWQVSYTFPCAIEALYSTHMLIRKPSVHGDQYINRKGFPSVNVQATCNSQELFTSVDVSWPGSVHDATMWRNSDAYRAIRENTSQYNFVGGRRVRFSTMADDSFYKSSNTGATVLQ